MEFDTKPGPDPKTEDFASRLGLQGEQAEIFRSLPEETQEHLFVHISVGRDTIESGESAYGTINTETGEIKKQE